MKNRRIAKLMGSVAVISFLSVSCVSTDDLSASVVSDRCGSSIQSVSEGIHLPFELLKNADYDTVKEIIGLPDMFDDFAEWGEFAGFSYSVNYLPFWEPEIPDPEAIQLRRMNHSLRMVIEDNWAEVVRDVENIIDEKYEAWEVISPIGNIFDNVSMAGIGDQDVRPKSNIEFILVDDIDSYVDSDIQKGYTTAEIRVTRVGAMMSVVDITYITMVEQTENSNPTSPIDLFANNTLSTDYDNVFFYEIGSERLTDINNKNPQLQLNVGATKDLPKTPVDRMIFNEDNRAPWIQGVIEERVGKYEDLDSFGYYEACGAASVRLMVAETELDEDKSNITAISYAARSH